VARGENGRGWKGRGAPPGRMTMLAMAAGRRPVARRKAERRILDDGEGCSGVDGEVGWELERRRRTGTPGILKYRGGGRCLLAFWNRKVRISYPWLCDRVWCSVS